MEQFLSQINLSNFTYNKNPTIGDKFSDFEILEIINRE